MSLLARVRERLVEPRLHGLDVDGADFTIAHRRILMDKRLARLVVEDVYARCRRLDETLLSGPGRRVEIGSGAGFLGEAFPDVVTTDVKPLPWVDVVCSGERLPFRDGSLRAAYALNAFHHFASPRRFLRELARVLHPGGGAILVEPHDGPAARLLFPRLHASEGYDMRAASWETPEAGPMSAANQALSHVVFVRDRATFEAEFPELEIAAREPHAHLAFVLGGGVNFRQLVPDALVPAVRLVERALAPLDPWLALQQCIVLRRR